MGASEKIQEAHDRYAALLDTARRREIADLKHLVADLLQVVETGSVNQIAVAKARKIARGKKWT